MESRLTNYPKYAAYLIDLAYHGMCDGGVAAVVISGSPLLNENAQ